MGLQRDTLELNGTAKGHLRFEWDCKGTIRFYSHAPLNDGDKFQEMRP